MDPLLELLMQRAAPAAPSAQPQQASTEVPVVPPSGGKTHTPPQAQRFANAQAMMGAYRNGWSPNPILLQLARR